MRDFLPVGYTYPAKQSTENPSIDTEELKRFESSRDDPSRYKSMNRDSSLSLSLHHFSPRGLPRLLS